MSVTEPIDAVNAGMAKQTEGRRLSLSRTSPPSVSIWLVWWLVSHALRDRQWWINYESFVAVCIDIKTQVSRRNPVFLSITFSSFQFLRIIIMIILRL